MFSRKYLSNTAVNIPLPTHTPKQTSGVATGSIKNARKIRRKLDSRCCWQISPKAVWRAMIHTKCRDECTKQIPDARIGTRHTYRQLIGSEGCVPEMCIHSCYPQHIICYSSQLKAYMYLLTRYTFNIHIIQFNIHIIHFWIGSVCPSGRYIHIIHFWIDSVSQSGRYILSSSECTHKAIHQMVHKDLCPSSWS